MSRDFAGCQPPSLPLLVQNKKMTRLPVAVSSFVAGDASDLSCLPLGFCVRIGWNHREERTGEGKAVLSAFSLRRKHWGLRRMQFLGWLPAVLTTSAWGGLRKLHF